MNTSILEDLFSALLKTHHARRLIMLNEEEPVKEHFIPFKKGERVYSHHYEQSGIVIKRLASRRYRVRLDDGTVVQLAVNKFGNVMRYHAAIAMKLRGETFDSHIRNVSVPGYEIYGSTDALFLKSQKLMKDTLAKTYGHLPK